VVRAQGLLSGVLNESELMTSAEIALATIALNNVESVIGVTSAAAQAARVQESTSRAARNEGQALSQRLATSEAENARLRAELEEAEQKLDAITSIERSIREQE
jgi:small-conductance mechanosensitive channel